MKKSIFKRVTSFVLASAVAASAMVTAFATTIKIMPGTYSKTPSSATDADATRYVAYQIFTGTIGNGDGGFSGKHEHDLDNVYGAVDVSAYAEDAEGFAAAVAAAVADVPEDESADDYAEKKKIADALTALFADYERDASNKGYAAWRADYDNAEAANHDEAVKFLNELYWENRHTMEDISWGSAVTNVEALLAALAAADFDGDKNPSTSTNNIEKAFDAIKAAYVAEKGTDEETIAAAEKTAAKRVAKLLAGNLQPSDFTGSVKVENDDINTEFLQKFAKVVYDAVKGASTKYASTWDTDNECWKITDSGNPDEGLPEGYYLIADTKETIGENDVRAPFFVDVFTGETVEIDLKSDAPNLDKTIEKVDGTDNTVADNDKSATAEIGDTISYKLVGTLPENFGDFYSAFYYRFTDTMCAGLTLDVSSIKVTIEGIDDEAVTVYENGAVVAAFSEILTAEKFGVSPADDTAGATMTVTFTDLLGALKAYLDEDFDEVEDWKEVKVVVEYDAILNDAAVVGEAGNKNGAKLTYTNDPNVDYDPDSKRPNDDPPGDTTTTTEKETFVYTYALDLDKENIDNEALDGAGFTVTDAAKTNNKGTAVFVKGDKEGEYIFVGWAAASFINHDGSLKADDFKAVEAVKARLEAVLGGADAVESAELLTEITVSTGEGYIDGGEDDTSLEKGKLSIKGLNTDVVYNFSETTSPENYDAVKDFQVTLVAEVEWTVEKATYENSGEKQDAGPFTFTGLPQQYPSYAEGETFTGDGVNGQDGTEYTVEKVSDYKYNGRLYEDTEGTGGTKVASSDKKTEILENGINSSAGHVTLRVEDPHQTNNMPGTGGSGVYFYYIVGGALVLLAGAALFFTRKKSDKKS